MREREGRERERERENEHTRGIDIGVCLLLVHCTGLNKAGGGRVFLLSGCGADYRFVSV